MMNLTTLIMCKKEKSLHEFINDDNENRSYLKGDIIEVEWKANPIYIAGDGGTKEIDNWVISTRKF